MTWAHETLIQLLDSDLLPVYLDVLQILKSKVNIQNMSFSNHLPLPFPQCPVLVEQVVHSSLSLVGGEAFSLLLKRPWNPVVGMSPVDRQVSPKHSLIKVDSRPFSSATTSNICFSSDSQTRMLRAMF